MELERVELGEVSQENKKMNTRCSHLLVELNKKLSVNSGFQWHQGCALCMANFLSQKNATDLNEEGR